MSSFLLSVFSKHNVEWALLLVYIFLDLSYGFKGLWLVICFKDFDIRSFEILIFQSLKFQRMKNYTIIINYY